MERSTGYVAVGAEAIRLVDESDFMKVYASTGIFTLDEGGLRSEPSSPAFSINLCLCFLFR